MLEEVTPKENCSKRDLYLFIFLCWFAYTIAYIGRLNYSACLVEIIDDLNTTRADAGLISSLFFFAYGIGQFVNGMLCQKYNSRLMVFIALAVSSIINFSMAFINDIRLMQVVWVFNGFAQSILWSSIIRIQSEYIPQKYVSKVVVIMSSTTAIGTFGAYGLSALCVYLGSWRAMFVLASGLVMLAAFVWYYGIGRFQKTAKRLTDSKDDKQTDGDNKKLKITLGVGLCFAVIILVGMANGFLKDGVTTWVPNILYEKFNMEKHYSILLTLLLPLISVCGAIICQSMTKIIKSHIVILSIMFAVSGAMLLLIYFVNNSIVLTLIAFIIVATCMAGANNVLTSALPLELRTIGSSGRLAGLINTFICIGSTIATYSLGILADNSGWSFVILTLMIIGLAVSVFCVPGSFIWKNNVGKNIKL